MKCTLLNLGEITLKISQKRAQNYKQDFHNNGKVAAEPGCPKQLCRRLKQLCLAYDTSEIEGKAQEDRDTADANRDTDETDA